MIRFALLAALAALVALPLPVRAGNDGVVPAHEQKNTSVSEARIDEMIGAQVPLNLVLRDETDQPIVLKDCTNGKPTILVPVYYRCPMLCTEVLNGLLKAVQQMPPDFSVGNQFNIVTVSMDPKEHGSKEFDNLVQRKKAAYIGEYARPGAETGWRFLTGSKESIALLLDTIGYRYEFDKMMKEYNHPSALVILSPQGKVTRYFYGIGFDGTYKLANAVPSATGEMEVPTTSLRLSLIEAADGKGGSLLDKLTLLCYRYDRLHQGYSLNVLRAVQAGGILTLIVVGAGIFFALRRDRRAPTGGTVCTA